MLCIFLEFAECYNSGFSYSLIAAAWRQIPVHDRLICIGVDALARLHAHILSVAAISQHSCRQKRAEALPAMRGKWKELRNWPNGPGNGQGKDNRYNPFGTNGGKYGLDGTVRLGEGDISEEGS